MKRILGLSWCASIVFIGCSGSMPSNLGLTNGKLAPCPNAPHCVSSQSTDKAKKMEPFSYTTSKEQAQEKLITILRSMKRTEVITIEDNYLHAECKSAIFRYVDDVEFYFDPEQKIIHFRSSSRLGYYDVGVNRRRMEKIRERFLQH